VGATGSVAGGTLAVGSVGVGLAVVGVGVGDEVVGAAVGLLVVGDGAGLLVVGDVVADVGAAVEGATDGFAELRVAAGDVAGAEAAGVPQVTLYAAGLDAATAGLVTTSTTFPDAGTHAGNVSGFAACVPAELKVSWTGLVFSPLDIAQ
jgi:hypothetical protein